jgi:hypothetical protein
MKESLEEEWHMNISCFLELTIQKNTLNN